MSIFQSVYRYKVDKEDRRMWKVLLAKKKYEDAKLFCKDDSFKLNRIRVRQAQDLFKQVRERSHYGNGANLDRYIVGITYSNIFLDPGPIREIRRNVQ